MLHVCLRHYLLLTLYIYVFFTKLYLLVRVSLWIQVSKTHVGLSRSLWLPSVAYTSLSKQQRLDKRAVTESISLCGDAMRPALGQLQPIRSGGCDAEHVPNSYSYIPQLTRTKCRPFTNSGDDSRGEYKCTFVIYGNYISYVYICVYISYVYVYNIYSY